MRQKSLVIGLLVVLAFLVSGFTYAFWAAGIAADDATQVGTIQVGTGNIVTSTVSVGAAVNSQGANALVPAGFAESGKITSLTLTFTVSWASTGLDASGLTSTLLVDLIGALNEDDEDVLAFFNASFNLGGSYTIVSDGSNVTVIATITMDEPANQAEYLLLAGQLIELEFSFEVAASNS